MATEVKARTSMDIMKEHSLKSAEAFMAMRKTLAEAGPIPTKYQEMIVCAGFIPTGQQRAFMTHAERAIAAGASIEELRQSVLLQLGAGATFPMVTTALGWVEDCFQ